MALSEPIIYKADAHIIKLAIEARMLDKEVPNKKNKNKYILAADSKTVKHCWISGSNDKQEILKRKKHWQVLCILTCF